MRVVGGPFASISCGEQHTCALKPDGAARCWGLGQEGRLGTSNESSASTPSIVAGGHAFSAIASGGAFTCALDTAQAAWCWGQGSTGQLGNDHTECSQDHCDPNSSWCPPRYSCISIVETTPVAVSGTQRFASISAGSDHACALTLSDPGGGAGAAWCWGDGIPLSREPIHAKVPFKIPGQPPTGVKTITAGNGGPTYALMAQDEGGAIYSLAGALWACSGGSRRQRMQ